MNEKGKFYINCDELGRLVEKFHPNTIIADLSREEIYRVFVPPLELPDDFDILADGSVFQAVTGSRPVFDFKDLKNKKKKIGALHKENCLK